MDQALDDKDKLKNAEKTIVEILTTCNTAQRTELKKVFKKQTKENLLQVLREELTNGNFLDLTLVMLREPLAFDIDMINVFIKDENRWPILIGLLIQKSKKDLQMIEEKYENRKFACLLLYRGCFFFFTFTTLFLEEFVTDRIPEHILLVKSFLNTKECSQILSGYQDVKDIHGFETFFSALWGFFQFSAIWAAENVFSLLSPGALYTQIIHSILSLKILNFVPVFHQSIEKTIRNEVYGNYADILFVLLKSQDETDEDSDIRLAANVLMKTAEDPKAFQKTLLETIAEESVVGIREICEAVRQMYQVELIDVVDEIFGPDDQAFKAALAACDDTAFFMAGCLNDALESQDDEALMRILVARSEVNFLT